MKIGINCNRVLSTYKTGLQWYAFYLIHNLAKISRGNSYVLYDFAFRDFSKKKELMRMYLPQQDNFENKLYRLRLGLTFVKYLPAEIFTGKIDILHALDPNMDTYTAFRAKKVVTVHDIIPCLTVYTNIEWGDYNLKRNERVAKKMKHAILKADKIIAISEHTKEDIIKHFSVNPSKISVIYQGKDEIFGPINNREKLKEVINKYNISKRFIITQYGNLPRKNLHRLFLSFEKTRKKDNYQLVVFGKIRKKSEMQKWYEIFRKLPAYIKDDIIFPGYIPTVDLPYLYGGAECYVSPSLYEGFGLPVIEAMACGCPVITSNTSSFPEVAGDAGVLINPYDVNEMAENMERLLLDEKLREQLKIKGLERAKLFSWENTAQETLKVYEEVYNGK